MFEFAQCTRRLSVLEKHVEKYLTSAEDLYIPMLNEYHSKIKELKIKILSVFTQDGYREYL